MGLPKTVCGHHWVSVASRPGPSRFISTFQIIYLISAQLIPCYPTSSHFTLTHPTSPGIISRHPVSSYHIQYIPTPWTLSLFAPSRQISSRKMSCRPNNTSYHLVNSYHVSCRVHLSRMISAQLNPSFSASYLSPQCGPWYAQSVSSPPHFRAVTVCTKKQNTEVLMHLQLVKREAAKPKLFPV